MRLVLCCTLGMVAFAPSPADEPGADGAAAKMFDAYIAAHAANGDFSGTVLVTRNGRRIFEKSYGDASRAFDVPNRGDTRFAVASVTKTFTAASIALLQNDGKLKIIDGLDVYLPEFAHAKKIKLWHLLAHSVRPR